MGFWWGGGVGGGCWGGGGGGWGGGCGVGVVGFVLWVFLVVWWWLCVVGGLLICILVMKGRLNGEGGRRDGNDEGELMRGGMMEENLILEWEVRMYVI